MDIECRTQLADAGPAWDSLLDLQPRPSPFLRSWWLDAVAEAEPRVLLVWDGPQLLGGLALQLDRPLGVARLRPLGFSLSPDRVGPLALPGHEAVVAAGLADWLTRPGNRLLDLTSVDDHVGLLEVLAARDAAVGRDVVDVLPFVEVTGSFDEYLLGRSRNLRKDIRRRRRRLADRDVHLRITGHDDLDRGLADLRRLHAATFGDRSLFLPVFDPFVRAATAGSQRGELRLFELVSGRGEVLASEIVMEVAGVTSLYQGGRTADPEWVSSGLGQTLFSQVLEAAWDRGQRRVELMRGGAAYKRRWATGLDPLVRGRAAVGRVAASARVVLPAAFRARQAWRSVASRTSVHDG